MDSSRSRLLRLFRANHATLQQNDSTELANVSLTNPSLAVISSNNLLAYQPRFTDAYGLQSGLAGVFINMVCFHAFSHSLDTIQYVKSFLKKRMVSGGEKL